VNQQTMSSKKKKKDPRAAAAKTTAGEGGQDQEEPAAPQSEDEDVHVDEESRVLSLEAELKKKDATIAKNDATIAALVEVVGASRGGSAGEAAAAASRAANMAELQEACSASQMDAILKKVSDLKLLAAAELGSVDGAIAIGKGSNYLNITRMRGELKKGTPTHRLFLMKAALTGELGQANGRAPLQLSGPEQNKVLAHLVELDATTELARRISQEDKNRSDTTGKEPTRLLFNVSTAELLQKIHDAGRLHLTGDSADFTHTLLECPSMIYHAARLAYIGSKMILEVVNVLGEVISPARIHRFLKSQPKYLLINPYGELNLSALLHRDDRVSSLITDLYRHAAPGGGEQASQLIAAFEASKHDDIIMSKKTKCLVSAYTQFEQSYNGMSELADYFEQPMLDMHILLLRMFQSFVQTPPSEMTSESCSLHRVPDLNPEIRTLVKKLKAQEDVSAEMVRDELGLMDFHFNMPLKKPDADPEDPDPKLKGKPPTPKAHAAAVSTDESNHESYRGRSSYRDRDRRGGGGDDRRGGGGGGRGRGGGGGADGDGFYRQRSTSRPPPETHCGLCGKSDHTNAGHCPQIEDSRWVPGRDGVYSRNGRCDNCRYNGHFQRDCPGQLRADKLLAHRRDKVAAANLAAAQPPAPNPWKDMDGRVSQSDDDYASETDSDASADG